MEINDIELLRRFMQDNGASQRVCKNALTLFSSGEDVYSWTNEPLKEYYDKDAIDKKVLAVTSSGDHILHAALAGAKDITGFDINRFSKYYAALKIAMIKTYTYDDFIKMFGNKDDRFLYFIGKIKTSSADMSNKLFSVYNDACFYLEEDKKEFWKEYFMLYKKQKVSMLKYLWKEHHFNNAYCEKSEYEKLRKSLFECDIKFIDSSIDDLYDNTKDKFDLMYISNIIGSTTIESPKVVFSIIKSLQKNLNKNGIIYDYSFANDDWKDKFLSQEDSSQILESKLPDYAIERMQLSCGNIYKFKLK